MVTEEKFGGIRKFSFSDGPVSFSAMDFGCTITDLLVPDSAGEPRNVVLGFDDPSEYESCDDSRGAIVGRVANRIRGAEFTLNGKNYTLDGNDGGNCLHSGFRRFEKMTWDAENATEEYGGKPYSGVLFSRLSESMEQGFPGNARVGVFYGLCGNEVLMRYTAESDGDTPLNLTNHSYFNLDGSETVLEHTLQLDCGEFLEAGETPLPTGRILGVSGTVFDFRAEKEIGRDIALLSASAGGGYDHCLVTGADEGRAVRVGRLSSKRSGISMEVFTNQRGVQLYTGNFLEGSKGRSGRILRKFGGVCLETQRFPNAVNEPSFPSCVLGAGEKYDSATILRFGF